LRAIAAVSVLVFHAGDASGFSLRSGLGIYTRRLEIGVSVFFLISGFLLYRPFAASHLSGRPSPGIGRFWIRRLLRIVPAYWLALTVTAYLMDVDIRGSNGWSFFFIHYGFAQIYFPSQALIGLSQAWSLCTEMTFYFFLPLYATLLAFRRRSQTNQLAAELIGLAVLVAISFGFREWASHLRPSEAVGVSLWLPSYFDWFALGMVLAVFSAWFTERQSEPIWLSHALMPWISWTCAAVTFWGVSHLGIPTHQLFYTISPGLSMLKQTLYGLISFFLLLPAVFGPDSGAIRGLLRSWPIASIGVISYGIYLWHTSWLTEYLSWTGDKLEMAPLLSMVLVALGLSILSASVSYFVMERPLLRLKASLSLWSRRDRTPSDLESATTL
jgi:peptidoglycan/LPS O-acetylase OafA/YrhL